MRSSTVLDRSALAADSPVSRELLVLWQHPETREIVPIGRFSHDGKTYCFVYTRAAATVPNFRPLPGLDDLGRRYETDRLPAVFRQRVMDPERPDYPDYLNSLGLDPAHATPWEQIVHSGGTRAGDTLQVMQVPTVAGGRARARFLANGVRHIPDRTRTISGHSVSITSEQHEAALRRLQPGDKVRVEREDDNPRDPRASLLTAEGVPLGYVPWALSSGVRSLMQTGALFAAVARIGDPSTPPHVRLVMDLDVPAPEGFEFDPDGRWEPLVTS